MNLMEPTTLFITTAPGLEGPLESELLQLGYTVREVRPKGVLIQGSLADAMRLNLHLRTGLYVLLLLKEFPCPNPEALYEQAHLLAWEQLIPADGYISIVSRVDDPSITNTMYPNLKLKDAIVDRMYAEVGSRPDSGPDRHRIVINLYWHHGRCWIYLNTSGEKLSDRNYRKMPWKAPLQETLAAGLLQTAGYTGDEPLVLPMCGSGTLAIEAALIAQQRPAGSLRSNFSFLHVKGFDGEAWKSLRLEGQKLKRKSPAAAIIATDISEKAVETARRNAQTAGVEQLIEFGVCDFAETPLPPAPGIVLMNPEYGERLGDTRQLEPLYKRIGDFFKQRCPGYSGYVFTGNLELAKKIGLRTSRRFIFFNGAIECRLLKFDLYAGARKHNGADAASLSPGGPKD